VNEILHPMSLILFEPQRAVNPRADDFTIEVGGAAVK
jgi:hypothetical protein